MPDFIWPTKTKRITSGFRPPHRSGHHGIDIADPGTHEIYAVADGTVSRSYLSESYGECIIITHTVDGQMWESLYAHLRSGSRKALQGNRVKQGQAIGIMGSTGRSTGQHLHFELHKGRWNMAKSNAVDPMVYISDGVLLQGDKGPDVRKLQQDLIVVGEKLPRGGADGHFEVETLEALKAFQARFGLIVDGKAGMKTLAKLKEVVSALPKPVKIIEEEEKMLKEAIVINSAADYGIVESLANVKNAPILLRKTAEIQEIAETVYVVGGSTKGIKGKKIIDLGGSNRFETAQKVGKHIGSL